LSSLGGHATPDDRARLGMSQAREDGLDGGNLMRRKKLKNYIDKRQSKTGGDEGDVSWKKFQVRGGGKKRKD